MSSNQLSFVLFADEEVIDIDASILKTPPEPPIDVDEDGINNEHSCGDHSAVDERRQLEEDQSIELARRLMAEEAVLSYQQHFDFLRESVNEYSQEDYEAMQNALEDDEEGHAAEFENNDGDLSYETMLYLGERIGDVKTERWTMIASREIEKLPTFYFERRHAVEGEAFADSDDSEHKCLICQCEYENGEKLSRLPCGHCFHGDCVAQWLSGKDFCPYCRQGIRKKD
jgi:E3 ubiquitin-protein ligase BIG BROTHER and related proteins